ncbi:MAG: biotin transporter BioY [Actinobacteria bacterium]|nr:biotin transporter BioY [Actinomycetota bacterium]
MNNISYGLTARINSKIIKKNNFLIKLAFTFAFAITMAVSANTFIYIPVTPVPITLQTLTVLISGIFLGSKFAFLSQLQYLMLGIIGFPVFAGFKSGIYTLLGPTGGYLIGFVFAAYVTGYIFENFSKNIKDNLYLSLISCMSGLIVIYLSGYIHLFGYLSSVMGSTAVKTLALKTFDLAVKPFILVEFIKFFIIIDSAAIWKLNSHHNFPGKNQTGI